MSYTVLCWSANASGYFAVPGRPVAPPMARPRRVDVSRQVILLVDYDNLDRPLRGRGTRQIVSRLLDVLGPVEADQSEPVRCRLYGGWSEGEASSRKAAALAPELQSQFPCHIPVGGWAGHGVVVRAELARSLASDPGVFLTHTHRRRGLPRVLRCDRAPFKDCAEPASCPIAPLEPLLRDATCPREGCQVEPHTILAREEQKMVDAMLVVDLLHFAETTSEQLVLVSDDDDFWPGIRFVLLRGGRVTHVVSRRRQATTSRFQYLWTDGYSQVVI